MWLSPLSTIQTLHEPIKCKDKNVIIIPGTTLTLGVPTIRPTVNMLLNIIDLNDFRIINTDTTTRTDTRNARQGLIDYGYIIILSSYLASNLQIIDNTSFSDHRINSITFSLRPICSTNYYYRSPKYKNCFRQQPTNWTPLRLFPVQLVSFLNCRLRKANDKNCLWQIIFWYLSKAGES